MIFKSLKIENGLLGEFYKDEFSHNTNLLFSKKNSVGKSTYLRILFHSMGYIIPDMYGMKFSTLETTLEIEENGCIFIILREPSNLKVIIEDSVYNFNLPSEHEIFLSKVFKTENSNVLKNLLGLMYVDQEKGWTLLNRGVVIGKNRFDIEDLLIGIGEVDCQKENALLAMLEKENKKYNALIDLKTIQEKINEENNNLTFNDDELEMKRKIDFANMSISDIKTKIKNIDNVISKNASLFQYLTSLHLVVIDSNNEEIPVNIDTLRGANDSIEILKTRKKFLTIEQRRLEDKLAVLTEELDSYYLHHNDFSKLIVDSENKNIYLFKSISNLDINLVEIQNIIAENKKQITTLKKTISTKISLNNELNKKVFSRLYRYCQDLDISSKVINDPRFLYTDKLKYYSGTDFHKLVIAFKVALHKAAEEYLNIRFPFVLDSPSGRELNEANIKVTLDFVLKELSGSQIIIASINKFESDRILNFNHYAIENHGLPLED